MDGMPAERARVMESVDIASVDSEGFLHSGPDGVNPSYYWTRFKCVTLVERATKD